LAQSWPQQAIHFIISFGAGGGADIASLHGSYMGAMFVHHSKVGWRMSAMGQKRTLRCVCAMSALPPKADIGWVCRDVRYVPKADIVRCGERRRYSITSSARDSSDCGTERPSALAVLRLMTSSYFVGA